MIKQREDFARITGKIESFREDMVRDLADLVRCRSVLSEAEDGAPFGRGVAEAYHRMLKIGEREGFDVFDCDDTEATSISADRRKTASWEFSAIWT